VPVIDLAVARDAWGLYIGEQQYGSLGYDGSERVLNMRYLLSLLHEYAATLGMIDLAVIPPAGACDDFHSLWGTDEVPFFSRYDGLMYFRLTPLGANCLDVKTDHQPAPIEVKAVLRVLPNLDRGNRARPGAERPIGVQRIRHSGFGPCLASGSQSTAGGHRRWQASRRNSRIPGGAQQCGAPRYGGALARRCGRANHTTPRPGTRL
jgi:hypothetical protein